jgi:uncharacterized protein YwqG
MMNKNKVRLPEILEPYRERFEKYVKPTIKLKLHPGLESKYWDSKIAGYPYLPIGFEFPKDSKGNEMFLMAQINFAHMPLLEGYPQKGILQFYITNDEKDCTLGLDFKHVGTMYQPNLQIDWRVLYFPEVDENNYQTNFTFFRNDKQYAVCTPVYIPYQEAWAAETYGVCLKIDFEKTLAPPLYGDYQTSLLLNADTPDTYDFWDRFGDSNESWEVIKLYNELNYQYGHKIGGYAGFSQEDPRMHYPDWENGIKKEYPLDEDNQWLLLLQLESDDYLQWGDCGVGHLFIRKKDLLNLDFSKVWYHWDCC